MSIEDARATVEHVILDAIAGTAHIHRMKPDAAELLVKEIAEALLRPHVIWAMRELSRPVETKP